MGGPGRGPAPAAGPLSGWWRKLNKLLLYNSMIAKRRLGRTELMVSEMVFGGGFVGGASDHPL